MTAHARHGAAVDKSPVINLQNKKTANNSSKENYVHWNHFTHCAHPDVNRRIPHVAPQQKLGLCPKRRPRTGRGDFADPDFNRHNLNLAGRKFRQLFRHRQKLKSPSKQKAEARNERTRIQGSDRNDPARVQRKAAEVRIITRLLEMHRHNHFLRITALDIVSFGVLSGF